ncbi:MAG: hypothetical protein AAGB04_11380 [Pseudomonadota bacterium]
MRKSTSDKDKKLARVRPKNRYMHRAKISEYRFLNVLRGFANDQTAEETARQVKLSEKRVREIYDLLRDKLMRAILERPFDFGWAGYFLFDDLEISQRGARILDAVSASDLFRSSLNRHAPRVGLTGEVSDRFSALLMEVTVRVFCALSMRKDNDTLYSDEMQEAFAKLQLVAIYIHQHRDNPDEPELFQAVTESFQAIMEDFPYFLAQDEFKSLVQGHTRHRFPNEVLYNDLRRYLLANPLTPNRGEPDA